MERLSLNNGAREDFLDIGGELRELLRKRGWENGALALFCPHTTAALTVNEGADPDVERDVLARLRALAPREGDYRHAEGNSDAHVKTSLLGPSLLVLVQDGALMLGTWQKVFFCEFDGPRRRELWAQWLPGA
ncbi:secondary thiamine-phosphate synthase enzyme YjbQ [Desulfovibrio aminophilus]|uniref:secondary thiamine-phosphate synthase enzyme YjbQ n=1 Tax=Desulfovibrio aminophilus TaxID=81425 RepID=UPI003399F913